MLGLFWDWRELLKQAPCQMRNSYDRPQLFIRLHETLPISNIIYTYTQYVEWKADFTLLTPSKGELVPNELLVIPSDNQHN